MPLRAKITNPVMLGATRQVCAPRSSPVRLSAVRTPQSPGGKLAIDDDND